MDLKTYYFREAKARSDEKFAEYEKKRKTRERTMKHCVAMFNEYWHHLKSLCEASGIEINFSFGADNVEDEIIITFTPWDRNSSFQLLSNINGKYQIVGYQNNQCEYLRSYEEEVIFLMGERFYKNLNEHP